MKWSILILAISYSSGLLSQIITIKDGSLRVPIENVNLSFKKLGAITNVDGIVDVSLFNDNDLVEISHLSYYTKKIEKRNFNETIYLEPKTNLLPTISLSGFSKIQISEKYPIFKIPHSKVNGLVTSTSSLLSNTSPVTVQEGQAGGGSPNYRGMEASRLLLILDGIPLNNTIYRSGHLQNSATINPFFIESITLLSGPASVGYGNGAMGGALIFKTQIPKRKNYALIHQQFESSSNSVTLNFKTNYYKKKLSHITAFSLKSSDNLKMGARRFHNYENWGREMTNKNEQLYTNYTKADFMHKSKYTINNKSSLLFGTQFSTTSNIYRFDKMNDTNSGNPKYENWYYGPQSRFFQNIIYKNNNKTHIFDDAIIIMALQNIEESRHTQKSGDAFLNNRNEKVNVYDFNMHLNKKINRIKLAYGLGTRKQGVTSTANISGNNFYTYNNTRYPDGGSRVVDLFFYSQANLLLTKKIDFLVGGRWNTSSLNAKYNSPNFYFENVKNSNNSFVKSALISFSPIKSININTAYYGGFRNPNIDDLGKIFSKDDINVVVPNKNLEPEYANNFELSFNYIASRLKLQIQLFNTVISNAINREYGTINGSDSIIYDGQMMRIQMNKNIEMANIKGISILGEFNVSDEISITADCNYLKGKSNNNMPLAHIPPFNSKINFKYQTTKHILSFYTQYNGWKDALEYDEGGIDNLIEATTDGNPSWCTLNLIYVNIINPSFQLSFGVKNILDAHYKTFGSGLSASGRNFVVAIHTSLGRK